MGAELPSSMPLRRDAAELAAVAVKLRKASAPAGREGTDIALMERGAIKDPNRHVH